MVNFQNGTVLTDGSYGILEIPSRKQRFRYAIRRFERENKNISGEEGCWIKFTSSTRIEILNRKMSAREHTKWRFYPSRGGNAYIFQPLGPSPSDSGVTSTG